MIDHALTMLLGCIVVMCMMVLVERFFETRMSSGSLFHMTRNHASISRIEWVHPPKMACYISTGILALYLVATVSLGFNSLSIGSIQSLSFGLSLFFLHVDRALLAFTILSTTASRQTFFTSGHLQIQNTWSQTP